MKPTLLALLCFSLFACHVDRKHIETSLALADDRPFASAATQLDRNFHWQGYGGATGLPGTVYHDISEISRTRATSKIHIILVYAPSIETLGWIIDRTFNIPFDKEIVEKLGHGIMFRVYISTHKAEQGAAANP
jgi:hypothetical protein